MKLLKFFALILFLGPNANANSEGPYEGKALRVFPGQIVKAKGYRYMARPWGRPIYSCDGELDRIINNTRTEARSKCEQRFGKCKIVPGVEHSWYWDRVHLSKLDLILRDPTLEDRIPSLNPIHGCLVIVTYTKDPQR